MVVFAAKITLTDNQKPGFWSARRSLRQAASLEEWHGLYSVSGAAGETRQLSNLDYGCGLEAGIWEGKIALGCGGAESTYLLICDIVTAVCDNVMPTVQDELLTLITPQATILNSLKIQPLTWRDDGALYILATPYAIGETWSGKSYLLQFDLPTDGLELLLSDADFISLVQD